MRVVIQRVSHANVKVEGETIGDIERGLLLLVGFQADDSEALVDKMLAKIVRMRIFEDQQGKMNVSVEDIKGSLLIVSQFTLYANPWTGRRPDFIRAARPDDAIPLYTYMIEKAKTFGLPVATGEFGADMKVNLCNDGPVTIWLDSDNI